MVERRVCTFCGIEIEPGTGRMYIKKDGVVYNFCTSKCYKNMILLARVPRRTTWTQYYAREKQVRMKGLPTEEAGRKKARKVKKPEAKPGEGPKEPEKEGEQAKPAAKAEQPKPEEKKAESKEPAKKVPAKKTEKPKQKTEQKSKEGEKK